LEAYAVNARSPLAWRFLLSVLMEMPPMLNWFADRGTYGLFMEWVFEVAGKDWLLRKVAANGGQPGFAAYRRVGGGYELHTLQVFTVTAEGISRNSAFQDPEVFAAFALSARLEAEGIVNVGSGMLLRQ
jgi:RNA polymerase sigma-70 factor, ECF subfamily